MARVLVTGGTGFLGAHCIVQLLKAGHEVRATVRDPSRAAEVGIMAQRGGTGAEDSIAIFVADLCADHGWPDAVAGCDYVFHVASPYPAKSPRNQNDLLRPARDGTLRVLRAARDAGVRRVVLTSSFAAIGYGSQGAKTVFTEADWTNPDDPIVQPYQRSKTIAERAAWDFISREGGALELAVINPVGIVGPILGPDLSTSIHLIRRMINGATPGCPNAWFGFVDVRDLADLHLKAMTNPAARGERFLATAGHFLNLRDVALTLRNGMGEAGRAISTRRIPDWLLKLVGLIDQEVRGLVPELGKQKNAVADKARRVLGWDPRSPEESLMATARSLKEYGLLDR